MKSNNIIGIDLAKNVFQVHKASNTGKKIWSKKCSRKEMIELMAQEPESNVGMEACGGAHYFAEKFISMGHDVKLIAPKHVKPYVKNNKNDVADAEAICEARQRENMRFVPIKSKEQMIISQVHKSRSMQIGNRTALINQIRGFLLEFGVTIPVGATKFMSNCVERLSKQELPNLLVDNIHRLLDEVRHIEETIDCYNAKIKEFYNNTPEAKRLSTIPGIGVITASAIIAIVPSVNCFKNGRDLSAYLGLVPRQLSSGGKTILGRISKKGNTYLRKLLVQGAMAVLRYAKKGTDKRSLWIQSLLLRLGTKKAAVALANKNARIVFALLKNGEQVYRT